MNAAAPDKRPKASEARQPRTPPLAEAVRRAVEQFEDVSGWPADRVTGVRRDGDGWSVLVDVVELERVPSSTSVLATYRVDLDWDGQLAGYQRLRRFSRNATDTS